MKDIDVLVSEVGPRDGLQNTKVFMPTDYKKKWITAAAAAGLREIVAEGLPGEALYGYVPAAGITKGFVSATGGK